MRRKTLISLLLSATLSVSLTILPIAGIPVFAAEEAAETAQTSEAAETVEEAAEEERISDTEESMQDIATYEETEVSTPQEAEMLEDNETDSEDRAIEDEAGQNAGESVQAGMAISDEEDGSQQEAEENIIYGTMDDEPAEYDEEVENEEEQDPFMANEADVITSGDCSAADDDNVTWTLTGAEDNMTLTISGEGNMDDYSPWDSYKNGIKNVCIENGVTNIGGSVFSGHTNLTSVSIPESVKYIGYNAFYGCSSLPEITIPDGVTSIGYGAFVNCTGLLEVTLSDSVESIDSSAFSGCRSLETVTMPVGLTSIGNKVFSGCSRLSAINIPDSVTSIGDSAFSGCTRLSEIDIPNNVRSIGESAFSGCTRLSEIDIPKNVKSIGDSAFSGSSSLTAARFHHGNEYVSIGSGAFTDCTKITIYGIPGSRSYEYAKDNGISFKPIGIPESDLVDYGPIFVSEDSCLWWTLSGTNSRLALTIRGKGGELGFKAVEASGWYEHRSDIESLFIEDGVTNLGNRAFGFCSNLTSVQIPDSVASIGNETFIGCSKLQTITIPDSVKSIGESAFSGCSSLQSISFCGNAPAFINADTNGAAASHCFDNVNAIVHYPAGDITWTDKVKQNFGGQIVWVEGESIPLNRTTISLPSASYSYTGGQIKPEVSVRYGGSALKNGRDYKVEYSNNTNIGTAKVMITGIGVCTGTITKEFKISRTANKITCNSFTRSYKAKAQVITLGAKAAGGDITYKSNTSAVKVNSKGKVTIGAKFTGVAKITITAGNQYYQTVSKTITVTVPSKVKLSSAKNTASKKITVKWKKNTKVTGYQIQYGLKSSFKGAKTITIKKNKITSKVIKGLKKGNKYYIRIRTYKTADGKKYYSAWSAKKSVTIKK